MNLDATPQELLFQVQQELDRRMDLLMDCLEEAGWFCPGTSSEQFPPSAIVALERVRMMRGHLQWAISWLVTQGDLPESES